MISEVFLVRVRGSHLLPPTAQAQMTTRDITQQALAVQNQSLASTARTKQRIEETITVSWGYLPKIGPWLCFDRLPHVTFPQIGVEVSDNLKRQTEDITKIKEDVDQVDSNLKRADKQIRMFMR